MIHGKATSEEIAPPQMPPQMSLTMQPKKDLLGLLKKFWYLPVIGYLAFKKKKR